MRTVIPLALALALMAGCGKKKAPEAAPASTTVETPAPPPPVPTEDVAMDDEPAQPAAPASNADFDVTLTYADGRTRDGHVKRVERGIDFYAEDGWTDDEITVQVESSSDLKDVSWDGIDLISITYGSRSDINCQYDSKFTPWMYMCVLKSTSKAKLDDGSSWTVSTRNKWRFTFDDDSQVEFYVYKLPAREQDSEAMGLDSVENYDLYGTLQGKVLEMAKSEAVTRIDVK